MAGQGGAGSFITTGGTYSLGLSSSVNYFGLWFSALDPGNQISFYNGSALVYSFTPAAFAGLVGPCPSNSGFCGNPNPSQAGNASQEYAFLNFYDSNGSFNKIVFNEDPAVGGFESDNHTIGNLTSDPGGTVTQASPRNRPRFSCLGGSGFAAMRATIRRRIIKA